MCQINLAFQIPTKGRSLENSICVHVLPTITLEIHYINSYGSLVYVYQISKLCPNSKGPNVGQNVAKHVQKLNSLEISL